MLRFDAIGLAGSQDDTNVEPRNAFVGQAALLSVSIDRGRFSYFAGLDIGKIETDFEGRDVSSVFRDENDDGSIDETDVLWPVPQASEDRTDYGLSVGGTFSINPDLVAFGSLRVGRIELETDRRVFKLDGVGAPGSPPSETPVPDFGFDGEGETTGVSYGAEIGLARSLLLPSGFVGTVSGSLAWAHERIDGFEEKSSELSDFGFEDDTTFTFGDDSRTSVLSRVGFAVARPFRAGGALIVPGLDASWFHEFADDSRSIDVRASDAVNPGGADFQISTTPPDRDYFMLGASLASISNNGFVISARVETLLGHDFIHENSLSLSAGVRF
ncbi:MAG: autotransporter outer membrane beta-barrel domain-containing protein [Pseudomonadota bacterium]